MVAPNSQQAAGPSYHQQPVSSADLEMGSDCDSRLPPILTTDEQSMDLQDETVTNEVKDQPSHMEDIQTVVEQLGYVPPFFIVAPPVFVFGVIVIRRRRTYSEGFPDEKQRYIPSKKCKREVPSQGQENDNANPSVASSSGMSSVFVPPPVYAVTSTTSVPNTVAPLDIQQDASVTEKVILSKRRNYDEAFSAKEEDHIPVNSEGCVPPPKTTTAPWSYEDAFSTGYEEPCSKRYKFDHDFSPELAFEIELEAMTRWFAALSIDYPAGASKSQKVVRKVTRYRAGGLRGASGVAFVNGMAYKSPRAYLLPCLDFFNADVFDYTGAGPARQAIKNDRHFGCEKRVPPVVERAPVIVVNEPVAVAVAVAVAVSPPPIDRPFEAIIERGLPTLPHVRGNPPTGTCQVSGRIPYTTHVRAHPPTGTCQAAG